MNIKNFKKLIKQAVVEALYEELPDLINESLVKYSRKQQINEALIEGEISVSNKSELSPEIRKKLSEKMGGLFGYTQPTETETLNEGLKVKNNSSNPFEEFMNDTKNNLTSQDISGLRNLE